MPNENVTKFLENGGKLEVEVVISQNRTATWHCYLYEGPADTKELEHHKGDEESSPFELKTPVNKLDKTLLMADAMINGKKGQKWALTRTVRQDGKIIENGTRKHTGTFTSPEANVMDEVRLEKK